MRGPGNLVIMGDAGEIDPGQLARDAASTVRTDDVPGPQPVTTVRSGDVEGDAVVILRHPGEFVPSADLDAQFARPLLEHGLEPVLRHRQDVQRVLLQERQVQLERAEDEGRDRRAEFAGEPAVQPAPVEHPDHLADHAVGPVPPRYVPGAAPRPAAGPRPA